MKKWKELLLISVLPCLFLAGCGRPRPEALKETVQLEAGETLTPEMLWEPYENQITEFRTDESAWHQVGTDIPVTIWTNGGEYTILVTVTDTTAPEIEGVSNLSVTMGGTVSYKSGVTVTDNSGEEIEVQVDNSEVNLSQVGDYSITYSAEDSSGNRTEQKTVLTVTDVSEVADEVRERITEIAEEVTDDSMSDYEKAWALYEWIGDNVDYSHSSGNRDSEYDGAYEALFRGYGDCYVFYATYKLLLDEVEISNMKVARVGGESNHWWNLVNTGDGWYHCDTSPRSNEELDHYYVCFMQTDEQIANYTAYAEEAYGRSNYYTFDTEAYPGRATEVIYESGY